eukprot:4237672-Prymnesium_polylepis.1
MRTPRCAPLLGRCRVFEHTPSMEGANAINLNCALPRLTLWQVTILLSCEHAHLMPLLTYTVSSSPCRASSSR